MKYSCNYCNDQSEPCVVEVTCVDPEPPYSCIYANNESDMEAEWKPIEENKKDFERNGIRADCSNREGHPSHIGEKLRSEIAAANAMIEKNKRGKILMQALDIINGDRQDKYGKPEDSFALIAEYWNSYLISLQKNILEKNGFNLKEYKLVPMLDCKGVAEMMMLFKIARMSGQVPSLDNYLDLVGYAGIAADMVEEDRK